MGVFNPFSLFQANSHLWGPQLMPSRVPCLHSVPSSDALPEASEGEAASAAGQRHGQDPGFRISAPERRDVGRL